MIFDNIFFTDQTKEEISRKECITGNKTKNSKMQILEKKPMTPEKLKFIYGMINTLF